MKKIAFLLVLSLLLSVSLTGCGAKTAMYMTDGVDYKNTELKAEYVSSEEVSVTFSADIFISGGYVSATVILLSEGSVIGSGNLLLQRKGDETLCTVSQNIPVTYHNYGEITVCIDTISAWYNK